MLSFTFLGWLVALETYKFANNFSGLNPDARDVTITSSDKDGASLPSRLDPAQDAKENDLPNAGTHPDRHVKIEDALPDKSHEDSGLNNNDHPSTAVGSSTDPRILVEPLPSSPTSNAAAAGTSAAFKPGVQGDSLGASGALPNQVAMQLASKTAQTLGTIAPTVSSVVASGGGIDGSGNGDLNAGHVVTLTVNLSDAVTVAGGVPTLSLNNGGTASYTGGSGSNALTFSYTVGAGEDTGDLSVTSFNLNGSTVSDAATNDAVVAGAVTNPSGILQIDTIAPTAPTIVGITLGGSGGNHWVWSGAAEANSDIAVFDGSTQLGTVTTPGLGAWNYTTTGLITNSSVHIFAATASDAAGNTSGISAAWIEGSSGNDTFVFSSEALLTAPVAINGNGGADTISMNAAVTLNSGDFGNVSGVQTLQLTGASAITLGADSVTAGIMNVTTGSGVTSIEDSNGVALNVNATALTDNTALSLSGTAGFTVTGLQGDITATGVSGSLNVTTVAVASGLSIATGSGSTAITASAFTTGQTLTLIGGSAATVTLNGGASTGSLAAGTYTGNLTVT
ncbi:MAG: hypothetical protein WBZ28_15845, partial [Pseudolabrys sp.]